MNELTTKTYYEEDMERMKIEKLINNMIVEFTEDDDDILEPEGSRIIVKNGCLGLEYFSKNGIIIDNVGIMPDIVNVSNPNDKVVFVEFADGTKEVALLSNDDVFNLETGVLICITKKLLSDITEENGTGSSAYNKIVKYALTKVDAKKKQKEAELRREKEERLRISSAKQELRKLEIKQREDKIKIIVEAFKRATKEISEEAQSELKAGFEELINELEKATKEN